MKRRTFVQTLGAAAASVLATPRAGFAAKRLDRVGLELYSVRNAMKADPDRTLAAVSKIGYTDVELLWSFNNFGRTPQQVLATLRHEGLRAPSAHIAAGMTDAGAHVIHVDEDRFAIEAACPTGAVATVSAMEGVSYVRCVFNYLRRPTEAQAA